MLLLQAVAPYPLLVDLQLVPLDPDLIGIGVILTIDVLPFGLMRLIPSGFLIVFSFYKAASLMAPFDARFLLGVACLLMVLAFFTRPPSDGSLRSRLRTACY